MIRFIFTIIELLSFGLVSLGSVVATVSFDEPAIYDHKNVLALNTPIVELNNLTLSEVFEEGNLLNNIVLLANTTGGGSYTPYHYINPTAQDNYLYNINTIPIQNHLYFISFDLVLTTGSFYLKSYSITNDLFGVNIITSSGHYKGISNLYSFDTGYYLIFDNYGYNAVDWDFSNLYSIDLTALGISDLTVEQMDKYYQMYEDLINDVELFTYTSYDITKNEITLNDIVMLFASALSWYFIIKMIRGLLA